MRPCLLAPAGSYGACHPQSDMTASSSSSTPSLERVIGEAFVVASKIILESRIYSPRSKNAQSEAKGRAWVSTNALQDSGCPTQPHVPHRAPLLTAAVQP